MRLIDASALTKKLNVFNDRMHGNEHFLNGIESAKEIIENEPTIDAIPIEFIQKRIDQLKEMNGRIFDYERWELERLVQKWREENATAD